MKRSNGSRHAGLAVAALFALCCASSVEAGGGHFAGGCGCGGCITYQTVERQIMVPKMVPQRRKIMVTECRPEIHERMVNVARVIPEVHQVVEPCIVMVPHKEVRQHRYVVRRPVWREVEQKCIVQVPHQEKRQGVRQVCHLVQVQATRKVCVDRGHWQEVACGGCGHCGGCGTCRVWCPNVVVEEVPVTVCRPQITQEPYDYYVTVFEPEERTQKVRVCEFVHEEKVRDIECVTMVPTKQDRTRNVTVCKTVVEQRPQRYTVMVPHQVEREIVEMICHMEPKVITCKVPVVTCGGHCGCWH